MMAKRKKTIPTYREWYEAHREQFERTERHFRERMAYLDRKIAERKAREEAEPA